MSLKHSFTKSIYFYHSQKNKIKKKLNKKKKDLTFFIKIGKV